MRRLLLILPLLLAATRPGLPHVRLDTAAGPIVLELDTRHAPITANNFLAYVDEHKFDGTSFYRAARSKADPHRGFVQGGVNHVASRSKFPIDHEPTSKTGLHHLDGTISMAMFQPGSAQGDWTILVGPAPSMDAHGKEPGYAAFGHVVSGMATVRRILAAQTLPNAGEAVMRGQLIAHPVTIVRATRVP